ncbi:hypothetical protein H110_01470 [Trichophyton rubrum MR1448]|nr:hypothetical protein H110_01470 [Trichophyton rubrum MR1448]
MGLVQGPLQTTIASTRDSAGGWSDECPVESHISEPKECNNVDGGSNSHSIWPIQCMVILSTHSNNFTGIFEARRDPCQLVEV